MNPRIYVASLSDYNNGRLHGVWIELAGKDIEEVSDEIRKMLSESRYLPAEEYAIHDHEEFAGWAPGEYETLETVVKVAQGLAEHGEAFGLWVDDRGDVDDALGSFEDAYEG